MYLVYEPIYATSQDIFIKFRFLLNEGNFDLNLYVFLQVEVRQSRLCFDDGEFPMAEKRPASSSSTLDTGREAKRARLESLDEVYT
jgi:hypothetical protein